METFSALLALCAGNSPVPVNSPHKGLWGGDLMFSLIYAWINDWVNNREAGDLRHHRGHCDVNVMQISHVIWTRFIYAVLWWLYFTSWWLSVVGDLAQHWFRKWLVAWRHQTITSTNVDLSSMRSCSIHLWIMSTCEPKILILSFLFQICTFEKKPAKSPWDNEVIDPCDCMSSCVA